MIVHCVVYRTMLTTGALFSCLFTVWFTEQCLLLELWSHDCSLVYRTVLTTGASQLLWLTSSTTPCTHHQVGCLLASFFLL